MIKPWYAMISTVNCGTGRLVLGSNFSFMVFKTSGMNEGKELFE